MRCVERLWYFIDIIYFLTLKFFFYNCKRVACVVRHLDNKDMMMMNIHPPIVRIYAYPVWPPNFKCAINKIESVQQMFTKQIPGLSRYSYMYLARLAQLALESLRARYIKANLVGCVLIKLCLLLSILIFFKSV